MLASDYTLATRSTYRGYLKRAGEHLGKIALDRLTGEELTSYRAEVLAARGFRASQVLMSARLFLGWAAERGLLRLSPEAIRESLRPPNAKAGMPQLARVPGRRRGPPPAAFTLDAFGYPSGSAGISLVVAEMRALREALRNANPGRWASLLRGTAHPGHRQAEGGAEELAPAAVLDADRGGRRAPSARKAVAIAAGHRRAAATQPGAHGVARALDGNGPFMPAAAPRSLGRSGGLDDRHCTAEPGAGLDRRAPGLSAQPRTIARVPGPADSR